MMIVINRKERQSKESSKKTPPCDANGYFTIDTVRLRMLPRCLRPDVDLFRPEFDHVTAVTSIKYRITTILMWHLRGRNIICLRISIRPRRS